jgi:hypothetical protein
VTRSADEPRAASGSGDLRKQLPSPESSELERTAAEEGRSRTTIAAWGVALLGFFAAAFFAERVLEPQSAPSQVEVIGAGPASSQRVEAPKSKREAPASPVEGAAASAPAGAQGASPLPEGAAAVVPEDSGFQIARSRWSNAFRGPAEGGRVAR